MKILNKITTSLFITLALSLTLPQTALAKDFDLGPLAPLIGKWKTVESGIDLAPGRTDSTVGEGSPAVEPFYEIRTFEVAADAVNASDQYLVAIYYKQEVFRKRDDAKFHDQRGYLIYDKKNNMVYNSYCIPRAVCIVAEGKAGSKMTLTAPQRGIAESSYMNAKATTTSFSMTIDISSDTLIYSQTTGLKIYGKDFPHTDSATLKKLP
ncbi:heme-binding beta-barrel domain-containing protein [Dasania marina]|uniref:heme-binding beta-barrel domain-containing protein n=1 Tax=Dasania marina TaxID=471499 RepID=UPI0030D7655E